MGNPYTLKIDPFVYENSTFLVTCRDAVVKMRIEQHIIQQGGNLAVQSLRYIVGDNGMSTVQFWIGAGQYDLLQNWERLEEALIFLSSETPFPDCELEKIYWYIRENRDQVIDKIFADNLTETLAGFLNHYTRVLPHDYTAILQSGQYENQILLDLTNELVDRADAQGNHELKAWLMEYRKATFPDSFVEETGIREGILFLDEINCVSETLTPAMLQFLQYKIFGRHRVPNGWVVITAGNPTEYNNSVREFDIVARDRLKRIDVEPDFDAWKQYALGATHPAVLTYLEIQNADFYTIETTVDGKRFATARGWSDLSDMMVLYEKLGLPIDEKLIAQYLQNPRIARDFAVYYDLWNKYRSDYQIENILSGAFDETTTQKAGEARFDEQLSLVGLLLSGVTTQLRQVCMDEQVLMELAAAFKALRMEVMRPGSDASAALEKQIIRMRQQIETGTREGNLSVDSRHVTKATIRVLESVLDDDGLNALKTVIDNRRTQLKSDAEAGGEVLDNLFRFCEKSFGDGQLMQILVTELTIHRDSAKFINRYGCARYFAHNQGLLLHDRKQELLALINDLAMPLA